MNTSNVNFIRQAQSALKAGQKQEARHFLQQAVRHDPQDYAAWLWLASITPSPRTAFEYVKRAEMLNPDAPAVQKARLWAEKRLRQMDASTAKAHDQLQVSGSKWRTIVVWGGAGVALIIVLLLAGAFLWRDRGTQASAASVAANVVARPGSVDVQREQVIAATVIQEPAPPRATPSPAPRNLAKNIAAADPSASEPRPRWTLTPTPTNTPVPTPTPVPTFVSDLNAGIASRPFGVGPNERWIDVNLTTQTLTAYEGNRPVLTSLISSGTWQHPTVTGQFRIYLRYESQTMDGRRLGYDYYLEGVPYVMYFYEDYALHGTFWHTNFGTPMSHGCVNMNTPDAAWLFDWSSIGTVVNVHY